MTRPELKLAIKPGAARTCHTIPHRVPLHWKEQVEEWLRRDLKMGITEELPANTPAKWCHKMVVTSKPGSPKPRRMVDMSALKTASYRHEDAREYTNFLTEWGMFRYKRNKLRKLSD
jgi:hypothetical protein